MLDVIVRNPSENWEFNWRFAALPRVGELITVELDGAHHVEVMSVRYEQSAEEAQLWIPRLVVERINQE